MTDTPPSPDAKLKLPKPLACPFCGVLPVIELGKLGHCQLHGEPSQEVEIYCNSSRCPARPIVSDGDIYNVAKGTSDSTAYKQAALEALEKWNTRAAPETAAERDRLRAQVERLAEALNISVRAMQAPLDDWKGEVERHALDLANAALAAVRGLK